MKTHNASTQSSILKITGDTSSNKLNLPQQQQQPQSIVSPISPTAEDVMSEARKNNVTVLAGLVDQLASRAQALVQCFMEVVKAQDLQLGSNTRPTQRENEKRKRLAPLWKAVYELCESIEATIPGYSNLSMEPYVYEVSKIVDLVSGQADPSGEPDGLVDVKTFEVCFPYFILKLLSTIKNSVKLYMDGEKAKKKSVVIDPAVLKQHFTDAMSNPMPAPHLRPQTQPPPQSSASTTITKTQQLFSVNPMPSLIPSDSSARVNSDFSNTTSIPALPSSSSSSKAIPKEPSSTDLSRQALDYVQKHAEVVRQLSVHAPPRKIESLEKLNNPTDKTATSNSVKKSTSHGRIAGTYEELHTSCDSLDKQQVTRTGGSTLPSKSESIKNLSAILVERKPSIKSASSSMPSRGKNSSENEVKQAWNIDASATISEKRNNIAGADQTITKSSSRIMLQSSSDPSTKEKMLRLANHNNRLQMPFVQNAASDSKKSKKTLSVLMEGNVRQAKEFFENAAIASSSIAVTSAAGNTLTKKPTINNGQQLPKTAKDSFSDRQQSSRDSSSSYSNTIDQAVDMVYIDNHSTLRLDYRPHVMGNGYIGANTTTTTIANATDGVFGARSGQHQQQTQEFSQFSQSDEYSEKVYVDDEEIAPSIVSVSVPPQVSEFLTKFGGSHPNSKRPSASAHSNTTTSTDHVKHRKKNGSDASVNTIVKELGAIDADKGPASVASEEEEEEDAAVKSTSAVMLAASSTITKPASFNPFTSEEEIVPLAASVKPDASAIPLPPPQALESHQTVVRRNRAQTVDQMIRHSIAPEEFYTQAAIANGYQIGDIRTSNNDQNTIKRKSMVADLNSWKASNFKTTEVGGQVKSRISRVFQPSVEDERSLAIAMENRAQKNINNYPTRSQPALYTSFSSNNNNENIYSGKNGVSSDDNNDDLEEFPSPSRPRMSNARPVAPTQSSDIRLSSANRQSVSLNNNRAEQIVPHSNMTENGAGSNDLISPDSLLQQQYQMYQQFEDNSYSRKVLEDLKLEESRKSSSQLRSNTTPLSTKLGNSSVASLSQISALQAVIEDQHTQVILIPLNGMFDLCYLNLSKPNMLGRSNTQKHARFKVFLTQVVSRSHVEMWEEDGKVYIRDIGSSSGTLLNSVRISEAGIQSSNFELQSGDIIQLGKDYIDPKNKGQKTSIVEAQHRCVRMQIVIVPGRKDAPAIRKIKNSESKNSVDRILHSEAGIGSSDNHVASVTGSQYSYASDHGASIPSAAPIAVVTSKKSLVGSKPPQLPPTVGLDLISNFNLMEEKQKIERQINDQQEKWEKGLKLTLQTRKTVGPESSPHIRQKYVLSMMGTASKIKRMVVSNDSGSIINVNLKGWETRRHILIEDLRPTFAKTKNLDICPGSPDQPNTFTIYVAGGPVLGTIEYVNNLKLNIIPVAHLAQIYQQYQSSFHGSPQHSPISTLASASPSESSNINFCVTGDFKEGSWIVIMKFTTSREQRLIGEAKGRQMTRKNLKEMRWMCPVEMEENIYSQIIFAAIVYLSQL